MSESMFDPDDFLNSSASGEMSTQVEPIPEDDHLAVIDKVEPKEIETKNGPRLILNVFWAIDNPELAERLGRNNLSVRQTIWLDMTEDGHLDISRGKNVGLGRLREAVGQNTGKAWKPADLVGAGPCMIRVTHDVQDDGTVYTNVSRVAAPE